MRRRVRAASSLVIPLFVAVIAGEAAAQEKVETAGGDTSASEATPLPPVEVVSPAEQLARKASRSQTAQQAASAATTADGTSEPTSQAAASSSGAGIFTLGQLDVIGGSTISNEAMWTFQKSSLDKAVNILPGVNLQPAQGSRNEANIFVRGFDRFRVPLSIDGVRIYLPADNRLDFARFLTPDISEIQVQKGYVSVLNGAGGLGGAINMVSRKPTKALELEARSGIITNGDANEVGSWNGYAYAGTKQDRYYAQVSGTIVDQNWFSLSDDFTPVRRANEDGGERNNSEFKDWRINLKAGYTPNATDEYALTYTSQHGSKSAPLHVSGEVNINNANTSTQRYWKWPEWDVSTLSFLSKTQVSDSTYVKTTAFYNTFQNLLQTYDNATYTSQTTAAPNPGAFNSPYDDEAYGGSFEAGTRMSSFNDIKLAVHYRRDVHREGDLRNPTSATPFQEPTQTNREDTWSLAAENTLHITRSLNFVTGLGYDRLTVLLAETFPNAATSGSPTRQDTPDFDAWNGQGALIYSYSNTGKAHASVSDRARFATVFERYSTRFGTTVANPDLAAERARNYELGVSDRLFSDVTVSTALFYAELKDSIQFVTRRSPAGNRYENVDGRHYGMEVSLDYDVTKTFRIGGNFTYLEQDLDFITPGAKPEGVPRHKAFVYLAWTATDKLTVIPSYEFASDRYSVVTSRAGQPNLNVPFYASAGSYDLLNLNVEYKVNENISASVGGTNLLDQNYELVEGFPAAGRQFFGNVRAKF